MVAAYACVHFLVDMVCAWAMFSRFLRTGYESMLVYNFCAFALQMPLGTLADLLHNRFRRLPALCAAAGSAITILGAFVHPSILGIGNALFHVGGGMDVMVDDLAKGRKGALLGLFVAPGAVGLYLGTALGKEIAGSWPLIFAALLLLPLLIICLRYGNVSPCGKEHLPTLQSAIPLILSCFLVVVLRSWVGLSVRFDWQATAIFGLLAVLATASGKACGGFLAARFGIGRTAACSLILAALFYLGAKIPAFGILALFLFNMSMPLTLYLLATNLPGMAGFSFGLLTFGIFFGFVPVYLQMEMHMTDTLAGALCSVISCLLLIFAGKAGNHDGVST